MRVNFLNLDRSPQRLAEFKAHNGHLKDVVRFPAIDGTKLDMGTLYANGTCAPDILNDWTSAAVGNAIGHFTLWQNTKEPQTIAEDDAIFHHDFDNLAPEVLASLPADWDMVVWGWNFDAAMAFTLFPGMTVSMHLNEAQLCANVKAFQAHNEPVVVYPLLWSYGAFAYCVSPKGAQTLLKRCIPIRRTLASWPEGVTGPAGTEGMWSVAIDVHFNSLYRDIKAFVCVPPLAASLNDRSRSTVQKPGGTPIRLKVVGA